MAEPKYMITVHGTIRRLSDEAVIPLDLGNADYLLYLAWVDEGNVALDPDEVELTLRTLPPPT